MYYFATNVTHTGGYVTGTPYAAPSGKNLWHEQVQAFGNICFEFTGNPGNPKFRDRSIRLFWLWRTNRWDWPFLFRCLEELKNVRVTWSTNTGRGCWSIIAGIRWSLIFRRNLISWRCARFFFCQDLFIRNSICIRRYCTSLHLMQVLPSLGHTFCIWLSFSLRWQYFISPAVYLVE